VALARVFDELTRRAVINALPIRRQYFMKLSARRVYKAAIVALAHRLCRLL
jgi:hypothetical protein